MYRFICDLCGWAGDDPEWAFRPARLALDGRLDGYEIPVCPECDNELEDRYADGKFG